MLADKHSHLPAAANIQTEAELSQSHKSTQDSGRLYLKRTHFLIKKLI